MDDRLVQRQLSPHIFIASNSLCSACSHNTHTPARRVVARAKRPLCDAGLQILEAATAAAKKTDKLQSSLQVSGAAARSGAHAPLTHVQALQAQLDRVASSQPMKRQETAADAEVCLRCVRARAKRLASRVGRCAASDASSSSFRHVCVRLNQGDERQTLPTRGITRVTCDSCNGAGPGVCKGIVERRASEC